MRHALASMVAGRLDEAEQAFTQVVAANPREHRALQALAVIALRSDRPEVALERARSAHALDRRNPEYLNTLGIACGACGQTEDAVAAFRRAVRERPAYADAHCNLGIALRRVGRFDEATNALRRAVALAPESAGAHVNLAKALLDADDPDAAAASLRTAVALDPRDPDSQNHLGIALQAVGRVDEAIECFRRAVESEPGAVDAHNNLGMALRLKGRAEEAAACFQAALALEPANVLVANNLGLALQALGRIDEAIHSLRAAVAAAPAFADAHANLGTVLKLAGRLDEAEVALRGALALQPRSSSALSNLGAVLQAQDRRAEAIELFDRALAEDPAHFDTLSNLGLALLTEGRIQDALARLEACVRLRPDSATAANNLAGAFRMQGDMRRAVECYRRALALDPDSPSAQSNLLASLNYLPEMSTVELLAEHRRFGERLEARLRAHWSAHANSRDPDRRLRVGYVSGDFRAHAMAFSIAPVLAHCDAARFETVCYANNAFEDDVTARLRSLAHEWRSVVGATDKDVAELIRRDGIDILVDLSGHTALNRLRVFARKAAPVQVAWLGYVTSTGLSAMDYRLTDARADPPGADEAGYTETLVRMPWVTVFEPAAGSPPVAPLPALGGGAFTFACLNHLAKVTSEVVGLWARLLLAVPDSRLLVGNAGDAGVQRRLVDAFAAHGVAAERLAFRQKLPLVDFLELHREIDLALDTFPYNGGATSCHSLWMGVPFVTLAGDRYMGRMGLSLLEEVGLGELVARTADEYVDLAAHVARDGARLAELRASMRERLSTSPLLDALGFARSLDAAYRGMWRTWCRDPERP
ncbi:MAG TPA: tetratricopeptide repeat protein [Burkholderiales bacterium]|nr:tetratricopeptide repeat protein [Burkholderiales bacterium]